MAIQGSQANDRYLLMRAMILGAYRAAQQLNGIDAADLIPPNAPFAKTVVGVLEGIVIGRYQTDMQSGKTLIHSAEAGGVTQFSISGELTPAEVTKTAVEAIVWVNSQSDPLNPPLYPSRRMKRLRASFAKATI